MWDERLTLAADLYKPCMVGADIGTDHAYLPALLLQRGTCRRMLLCDISQGSLLQAEATVRKYHLEDRTRLILADGLDALDEPCGCVSVMGMGGQVMADILQRGRERLHGAVLVLSSHTEPWLVRGAVQEIGYHLTAERLCRAGGRYYLVWRAEPGAQTMNDEARMFGSLVYETTSEHLIPYIRWRIRIAEKKLQGASMAAEREAGTIREAEHELAFYRERLSILMK